MNTCCGLQASAGAPIHTDQVDTIFEDLEDLEINLEDLGDSLNGDENAYDTGHEVIYNSERTFSFNNKTMLCLDHREYLEMNDLNVPLSSTNQDRQMVNAAYSGSSLIEQPCFPYSSFGAAANQNVPSCQYPSLYHSNNQMCHPADLDTLMHTSDSIQSALVQVRNQQCLNL